MRVKIEPILLLLSIALALPLTVRADAPPALVLIPESRHQLYETYGLFFEQQSALIARSAGKAWAAIGGTIALVEFSTLPGRPQLYADATANVSYRVDATQAILRTETVDARVGVGIEAEITPTLRVSFSWQHQSGHIADDVPDPILIGPNLGNEILFLRLVKDWDARWRTGATLRPVLGSDPGMMRFGADQFGELFPWGEASSPHSFAPYIAAGVEEYGRSSVDSTFHAQIGIASGPHFSGTRVPSVRFVLGYYDGVDPRLKYFQFFNARSSFAYLGTMLDL